MKTDRPATPIQNSTARSGLSQSPPSSEPDTASPAPAPGVQSPRSCSGPPTRGAFIPRRRRSSSSCSQASRSRSSPEFPPPPLPPAKAAAKTRNLSSSTKSPASGLPCSAARSNCRHVLISLVLFRLFDITKPFPMRRLENLPEGWGIVFDDVAAGLYAWGVGALLRIWF